MNKIQQVIERVNQTLSNVEAGARALAEAVQKAEPVVKQIGAVVEKIPRFVSDKWIEHANKGWYPNWFTPAFSSLSADDKLDQFMSGHLTCELDNIEAKLIGQYPNRKEIFKTAFVCHRSQQFIASVPIFFAQADGICNETICAMLLTKHKSRQEKIDDILARKTDFISHVMLPILKEKTQMGENFARSSETDKQRGPNRNGILHGSSLHLDYGTEINSLKSLSLLAFVATTFEIADVSE